VYSAQTHLLKGKIVTIEVDITPKTLHAFTIVGLPDKAVDESKDRMSSALKNSGFKSPKSQNQKIIISLSPADLKKEGPYFDLAMALAYLLSAEEIDFDPKEKIFLGELSLNGELQLIKGVLPLTEQAMRLGYKEIFVPKGNASEAALVKGITVYGAENLKEVIDHVSDYDPEGKSTSYGAGRKGKSIDVKSRKILAQKLTAIRCNSRHRFFGYPGARERQTRSGNCRGRRAQYRSLWSAGDRQDHACQSVFAHLAGA